MISSLKASAGFRLRLGLQLLLLLAAVFLFCYATLVETLLVTASLAFALILLYAFNLFRLVDETERDFARFLDNVRHGDFACAPRPPEEGARAAGRASLARAQDVILAKFRQLNRERDTDHRYLGMVVEHVNVALVCFDGTGNVRLLNEAARGLLGLRDMIHVSRLEQVDAALAVQVRNLPPGRQKLLHCRIGGEPRQLMINAAEFSVPGERHRLVSLQDVKHALDENEIKSWQKLMRVLNHEIMNSMTPIVSLSRYAEDFIGDGERLARALAAGDDRARRSLPFPAEGETGSGSGHESAEDSGLEDLRRCVAAIHSRSKGLVDFIGGYRGLHAPARTLIGTNRLQDLLARIGILFAERFAALGIHYESPTAIPALALHADIHALEQILINLLSNAVEAVEGRADPRVALRLDRQADGMLRVHVSDNGRGIPQGLLDDIFTPFFTTKDKGSGIGLSLSRQLAQLNDGRLGVRSEEGVGSVFTLSLPLA